MNFNPNKTMPDVSMRAFDPPMPTLPRYPIERLHKVRVFASAQEFSKVMAVQPPAFDEEFRFDWDKAAPLAAPGAVAKAWIDTAPFEAGKAPTDIVRYAFIKTVNSQPVVAMMEMTVAQAAMYNMPDQHKFAKLVIAQTPAWFIAPNAGSPAGVNPAYIILRENAQAIADEINRDCKLVGDQAVTVVDGILPGFPESVTEGVNWESDQRRPWDLLWADGSTSDASIMYAARHKAGIDTPGKFVVQDAFHGGKAAWVPDTDDTVAGTCPTPIRMLVSGQEQLVGSPLTSLEVVRLDSQFTPQDAFQEYLVRELGDIKELVRLLKDKI